MSKKNGRLITVDYTAVLFLVSFVRGYLGRLICK